MTNILIVIDPEETEQSALNRVKEIPVDADINFKVDYYVDAVPVMAKEAHSADMHYTQEHEWLDDAVAPLRDAGYEVKTEVIPFTRLYEEIIRSAARFNADFVFKPMRQHGVLKRVFYTSTDWNLIRLCPIPLLLVSDEKSDHGKPVVAAIDVGDKDNSHKELNQVVLSQAELLGRVLGSDIHVVYAYGPAIVSGRTAVADPLAYQIARDRYDDYLKMAKDLAAEHNIPCENVHLREGAPEIVVNQYAEEVGASVIVLGTVARSGAAGLFVGNTAEGVLERARNDVFVVKQPGFSTPV